MFKYKSINTLILYIIEFFNYYQCTYLIVYMIHSKAILPLTSCSTTVLNNSIMT